MKIKKIIGAAFALCAVGALASCDFDFNLSDLMAKGTGTTELPELTDITDIPDVTLPTQTDIEVSTDNGTEAPAQSTNVSDDSVLNILNGDVKLDVVEISAYSVDNNNQKKLLTFKNNKIEFKPGKNAVSITIRSNILIEFSEMTLGFNHNSTTAVITPDKDNSTNSVEDGYYYSKLIAEFDFSNHLESTGMKITFDAITLMMNKNKFKISGDMLKGLGVLYDLVPYNINFYVQGKLYDSQTSLNYVVLPEAPARDGYEFLGWSKTLGMSDYINPNVKLTEDVDLYAVYKDLTPASEYAKLDSCIYYNNFENGANIENDVLSFTSGDATYEDYNGSLNLISGAVYYKFNELYESGKLTLFFDLSANRFNVETMFGINTRTENAYSDSLFALRSEHTGTLKYDTIGVENQPVNKVGEVLSVRTKYTIRVDVDIDNNEITLSVDGKIINRYEVEISNVSGFKFRSVLTGATPKTIDNIVVCYQKNDGIESLSAKRNQVRSMIKLGLFNLELSNVDPLIKELINEKADSLLASLSVCDTEAEINTLTQKVTELFTNQSCIITFMYAFDGTEYTKSIQKVVSANEILLMDQVSIDDYTILGAYYDAERTMPITGIAANENMTYYLDTAKREYQTDKFTIDNYNEKWSEAYNSYDPDTGVSCIKLDNTYSISYSLVEGSPKTVFVSLYGRTNGTQYAQEYLKITAYNKEGKAVGVAFGTTPLQKEAGYFTQNGENTIRLDAYDDIDRLVITCAAEEKKIFIYEMSVSYYYDKNE